MTRAQPTSYLAVLRERAPYAILALILANTAVGLAGWVHWQTTGEVRWLIAFFRYPNTFFIILVGAAEVGFCAYARQQFERGDALRSAWSWLTLAAMAHFTGTLLTTFFESRTDSPSQWNTIHDAGQALGGPAQMALLLVGLVRVAIHCRRLGLLKRLTRSDHLLLALVLGLTVRTVYGIWRYLSGGKPVTWVMAANWTSDPMLILLLVVAVLIRRSVFRMGRGMIANCWRSFVAAILLTVIADAGLWCLQCTSAPWAGLGWYLWFIADATFALAPAFQVAALEHARSRSRLLNAIADWA